VSDAISVVPGVSAPAWRLLAARPWASAFQSWAWASSWWEAHGGTAEAIVLSIETPAGAGIVQLCRAPYGGRLTPGMRVVRLIGDGTGDAEGLEPLVPPRAAAAAAAAIVNRLASEPDSWDLLELAALPADSPHAPAITQAAGDRGWLVRATRTPRFFVPLSDGWEGVLARLSRSRRATIRYQLRRVERDDGWRLIRVQGGSVPSTVQALFELHQRRWGARSGGGNFRDVARRRFYLLLASRLDEEGKLDLWRLDHQRTPVAVHFGMRSGTVHSYLDGGFDPALGRWSPGTVLTSMVLRHLADEGASHFDFLGGRDPYKLGWAPVESAYVTLRIARPRTLAAVRLRAEAVADAVRRAGTAR
jgi:CelD/BcsL family acetyltransferase involved in cellulose biosynthesis